MSHAQLARDPDLSRLVDDGYNVSITANYLVVRDIPYVDETQQVQRKSFLAYPVEVSGDRIVNATDHRLWFGGTHPCDENGKKLILATPELLAISSDLTAQFMLSSKPGPESGGVPGGGYVDQYSKVTTYIGIVSHPALALDPTATATPGAAWLDVEEDSPFCYPDTATSRAGLGVLSQVFAGQSVAIIGLGGTGGYILDQVAKTPVNRILLIDGDTFDNHNAFRAPGAPALDALRSRPLKVDYFAGLYSHMHRHIETAPVFLDAENVSLLDGSTFVFLASDDASAKPALTSWLEDHHVPFIDVGMGVEEVDGHLTALLRTTASFPGQGDHVPRRNRIPGPVPQPDDYGRNIQVADLNALNGVLAVLRWKRHLGYYADETHEGVSTFAVSTNDITNEDGPCPAV